MAGREMWAELRREMDGRLDFDVPMKDFTTYGVGGPAAVLARPETDAELAGILSLCRRRDLPYFILGAGSNLLFLDEGFEGVVVKLGGGFRNIEHRGDGRVRAGAAAPVGQLLDKAVEWSLGGLECLAGIPGTVGGAVWMNAGSFGRTVGQAVTGLRYLDPRGTFGQARTGDQLEFTYRRLHGLPAGSVILEAELSLEADRREDIQARIREHLATRAERHPRGVRSAGSVFKNPPGLAAGKIIEECGLKGAAIGGAMVSELHGNFIVNPEGRAASRDILELIKLVMAGVRERRGLALELEIKIIGSSGEVDVHGQN